VRELRYREAFHLSYEQLLAEPNEQLELAFFVWEQDRLRAKLKAESSNKRS
jgi:hypothetical protein